MDLMKLHHSDDSLIKTISVIEKMIGNDWSNHMKNFDETLSNNRLDQLCFSNIECIWSF